MSRSSLRLQPILAGRTREELKAGALSAARDLGFEFMVFCGSFSPPGGKGGLRFDNLPDSWRRHCASRSKDLLPGPLRREALQDVTPLLWCRASPESARSLARLRAYGIAAGVSCSVRGPGGQWSLTSFALAREGASAEQHIETALSDCQLAACAIHYAAARTIGSSADRDLPPRRPGNGLLSARESQCLIESARGKTTAEIARTLQISERTVAFHLANVRRKLDAANSRHAVTKALALRLIAASER